LANPGRTANIPGSCGAVAQLGERCVRNAEVVGSIPIRSTNESQEKPEHSASRRGAFFMFSGIPSLH
jgi:hypothetical protein